MDTSTSLSTRPTVRSFAFDCPDTLALAGFYSELLGLPVHPDSDAEWALIMLPGGVRLAFQQVSDYVAPQWPDGSPQQAHLDLTAPDLDAHHVQALAAGAVPVDPDETRDQTVARGWRVYLDPAGHPFCLCTPGGGAWT